MLFNRPIINRHAIIILHITFYALQKMCKQPFKQHIAQLRCKKLLGKEVKTDL